MRFSLSRPKAVIAITLVLIHMHAVVLDQAIDPVAIEQVAGGVVVEALDVLTQRRGAAAVHTLDLFDGVVAVLGAALIALPVDDWFWNRPIRLSLAAIVGRLPPGRWV